MSGVLFLCVANSARSQLAEALARELAPPGVEVFSAGSSPSHLNPAVVQVLAEIGVEAHGLRSKPIAEIPAERVGTVITLCAEEVCPAWLGEATRLHWPLPDPAAVEDEGERLEAFRRVRDEIHGRLREHFSA